MRIEKEFTSAHRNNNINVNKMNNLLFFILFDIYFKINDYRTINLVFKLVCK
jgi:hypothetical protein